MFKLYSIQQEQQQDYAKTNCYLYIKCHALAYRWITGVTTENADNGINFAAESPLFPCKSLQIQIIMYSFKPTAFVSYS